MGKKAKAAANPEEPLTRKERRRARRQERKAAKAEGGKKGGGRARVDKYVPDSSLGDDEFFDQAQFFLSDDRLNPEDDPTLSAYVDALTNRLNENFDYQMSGTAAQAAGAGRMGSSYYEADMRNARDQFQENYDDTLAGVYQGAREAALGRRMDMIGLGNQRDISAGQIAAQIRGQNQQAAASRAALNFERQKWNEQAPLMYMDSLTGLLGGLDALGGYGLSPGYVANPAEPNYASGAGIALGAAAAGFGAYAGMGGRGYLGQQRGPG